MTKTQTFVLVHGAFHGGWCWRAVADLLAARGHRVFTPTLTGLGERAHLLRPGIGWDTFITDITQVLHFEELSGVTLVGHSFSGATITGVADRMPQALRRLIYFDAMILEAGQSALDSAPPELIEGYRERAQAFSGGLSVPPNPPAYYGITRPDQAARLERLMTPHPFATYFDPMPLSGPVGAGLPAHYIACTAPELAATAAARAYAKARTDWEYIEFPHPHNAMMTAPEAAANLLERLTEG